MEQNIQSIIPPAEVQVKGDGNGKVLELVRRFLQVATEKMPEAIRVTKRGDGFTLLKSAESLVSLNDLTSQCFDMSLIQFQKEMSTAGFRLRNRVQEGKEALKTFYKYRQPFLSGGNVEEDSCSEHSMQAGLIRQEEEQVQKDSRSPKPSKPQLLIGRFQSDCLLGSTKKRPSDQDSIQMKLFEQDLFCTPSAHRKNTSNIHQIDQESAQPLPMADRNALFRQNYEKCSRLIDNAMIEILTAHRGRKIGERAEELLGKVVEIYDVLSDNIENVNSTVRATGRGERKESGSSPGFKPLNGLNDNHK